MSDFNSIIFHIALEFFLLIIIMTMEECRSPTKSSIFSEEQLLSACQRGSHDEVKHQISGGVNINALDKTGSSFLFYCCSSEQLSIIRLLTSAGIDINVVNARGNTALHIAARKGLYQISFLLLLSGADAEIRNNLSKTAEDINQNLCPLIELVKEGNLVKLLTEPQKKKLQHIFEEVEKKGVGIDIEKCASFNRFMNEIPEETALKDAEDFINSHGICQKDLVNIDEWLFAFGKLAQDSGLEAVDSFISEYTRNTRKRDKYTEFINN